MYCVRAESGERGRDDENLDAIVVPTSDRLPLMDRHVLVSRLGPRHATRRHRLVSVGAAMGNTAVSVLGLSWATPPCQYRGCRSTLIAPNQSLPRVRHDVYTNRYA